MTQYRLSHNASRSLEGIREYSLQQFGKHQTRAYLESLREKMSMLAQAPGRGKQRHDLFADGTCYSYFEGSHTIYYEISGDTGINIIDVLHQSMDPGYHLEDI